MAASAAFRISAVSHALVAFSHGRPPRGDTETPAPRGSASRTALSRRSPNSWPSGRNTAAPGTGADAVMASATAASTASRSRPRLASARASVLEAAWLRARLGEADYLAGQDAEVAACDAMTVPVVTGHADMPVIDKIIELSLSAARSCSATGTARGPAGATAQPPPPMSTTSAASGTAAKQAFITVRCYASIITTSAFTAGAGRSPSAPTGRCRPAAPTADRS